MLESEVERYAFKKAAEHLWFVRKVSWAGCNAAPDRLFARKRRKAFFVEFKAPGEKLRDDQKWEIRLMREAGLTVFVWDSKEAVDAFPW